MMDKKGIMRKQLGTLILAIIGFAIVLYFVTSVIFPLIFATTTREACHNSVLLRSSIIDKAIGPTELVIKLPPIKCKTEYKCLANQGECREDYQKISVKNEEEIKAEIANSMKDCWWMLGEGTAKFTGDWERGYFKGDSNCIICSVIEFNDEIKEQVPQIKGFGKYLNEELIPGKNITYMQYLSLNPESKSELHIDVEDSFPTSQRRAIVYSLTKHSSKNAIWAHTFGGAAVGAVIGSVIPVGGTAVGAGIGVLVGGTLGWVESLFAYKPDYFISIFLVPHEVEGIQAMCGSLESLP